MKGYGKNGNKLVGKKSHPVAAFTDEGYKVKEFRTLREAAEWCVSEGKSRSINAAQVAITHAVNGKQHYYGKDWNCESAFGLHWESLR